MSRMVRKQIYLERRQDRAVKRLARRTKRSESEIIRAGVDAVLEEGNAREQRRKAFEQYESLIKQRMAKGPSPGKRDWTREDIYNDAVPDPR